MITSCANRWRRSWIWRFVFACTILPLAWAEASEDPLSLWNDVASKQAIVDFVARITEKGGSDFVPPHERIATFDNDGTLWCEKPMYVQVVFAIDQVKKLAPQHPEWKHEEPFKSLLAGDMDAALAGGEKAGMRFMMESHANVTTARFTQIVREWLATARHPRFHRRYTDLAYTPMLEVLAYLRANGFKTFIVSGGGIEFMRPWTPRVYGIPTEQVVGSSIVVEYEMRDGEPVLMRLPKVDFVDDKAGKPVGINHFVGKRPIFAFGNSDGDFEMLQWTTTGDGPRLGMIVHHTDAVREYAYDRHSEVGRLDRALDAAPKNGWILVNMKDDWRKVFSFDKEED